MRNRFFWRYSLLPQYVQDADSFIYLGRWTHIWNRSARRWFVVTDVPKDPKSLRRERGILEPIPFSQWLKAVGPRGWLEIVEDFVGIRVISRWLDKRQKPDDIEKYEKARIIP